MSIEQRLARRIGETIAVMDFGYKQGLGKLGGTIFNALTPFSTNTFTISSHFEPELRSVIEEAVKLSHLPEGIHIATEDEQKPIKPYVVVTYCERIDHYAKPRMRRLFRAGALDVVDFQSDPINLAKDLDR